MKPRSTAFFMPQEWAVLAMAKALEAWEGMLADLNLDERSRFIAALAVYQSEIDACSLRADIDRAERQ